MTASGGAPSRRPSRRCCKRAWTAILTPSTSTSAARKLTAREVADTASRMAASLQALGVQRGDRVATLVENSPEALLAWWGTIWAGAVSVPINTAYKGEYLSTSCATPALGC